MHAPLTRNPKPWEPQTPSNFGLLRLVVQEEAGGRSRGGRPAISVFGVDRGVEFSAAMARLWRAIKHHLAETQSNDFEKESALIAAGRIKGGPPTTSECLHGIQTCRTHLAAKQGGCREVNGGHYGTSTGLEEENRAHQNDRHRPLHTSGFGLNPELWVESRFTLGGRTLTCQTRSLEPYSPRLTLPNPAIFIPSSKPCTAMHSLKKAPKTPEARKDSGRPTTS